MRSVHRVLLKQMRLQQATEAGDAEFWIAQIVAECVPDGRTNHGDSRTCRALFLARRVGGGWPNDLVKTWEGAGLRQFQFVALATSVRKLKRAKKWAKVTDKFDLSRKKLDVIGRPIELRRILFRNFTSNFTPAIFLVFHTFCWLFCYRKLRTCIWLLQDVLLLIDLAYCL